MREKNNQITLIIMMIIIQYLWVCVSQRSY